MPTDMPAWITSSLAERLEGVSRSDLSQRALRISETYRGGGNSSRIDHALDAVAYVTARMPATYAATRAAFSHIAEMAPDFTPASVFDAGAGPGTATWAAFQAWPSLRRAHLLDRNETMLGIARDLATASPQEDAQFQFEFGSLPKGFDEAAKADLVVASYALTELEPSAALAGVAELWRIAARMLVIIEPGTPDGFARVLRYRDALTSEGAHIVAPCTHRLACPLANTPRWCHFSRRLARSREHLALKKANVPFEDERYSYLAVSRMDMPPPHVRRVLATPKVSKAHVALTLCAPGIAEERLVPRKSGDAYRAAKRADWGDAIED